MIIRLKTMGIRTLQWLGGLLFILANNSSAQVSKDLEYIDFLIGNNQYTDAGFFLNVIDSSRLNSPAKDSLNYFYAKNYHFKKKSDSASVFYGKVRPSSNYYVRAVLYGSLNDLYANKYITGRLFEINVDTSKILNQQKKIQLCGLWILKRNLKAADSISNGFDYASYLYSREEESLVKLSAEASKMSKKKPVVAAMLSAVVPGLGKYYAGRRGQAIATFFSTIGLGLISAESLYRSGFKSPQFIISASVFSMFYIGNIVGSGYSVRMVKKKKENLINNEVKSVVHSSLRRIYN